MHRYEWKDGCRLKGDATKAGRRIDRLEKQLGRYPTAQDVLDDAQGGSSPLHKYFTWNDKIAATTHRLEQARHLLRSLIIVEEGDHKPQVIELRARLCVDSTDNYPSRQEVKCKPKLRSQYVADALKELRSWVQKYSDFKELGAIRRTLRPFL